jgi:hypothetical protein
LEKLAALLEKDSRPYQVGPNQVVEWGTRPEFAGLDPALFAQAGYSVARVQLSRNLAEKAERDGRPVVLAKAEVLSRSLGDLMRGVGLRSTPLTRGELGTRDIVLKKAGQEPLAGLKIGSLLKFKFTTRRAGFVSIINFGTSPKLWLHAPNGYVGPASACAQAGGSYEIPGKELLPPERLAADGLEYREDGPPGWETLAVVVSDQPWISESTTQRARREGPIVELLPDEVAGLARRLAEWNPSSWSSGVLSFFVSAW